MKVEVFLKGGAAVEVDYEDLETFLEENRHRLERRRFTPKRPPVDSEFSSEERNAEGSRASP